MSAGTAVVDCRDLVIGYGGRPALRDVTGTVAAGELLAVVGPNGGGKSSFLRALAGEIAPMSGTLRLRLPPGGTVGYLPQATDLDRTFPITVSEFASAGLWRRVGPFGRVDQTRRRQVAGALARTGSLELSGHLLSELSGGQLQRVLFARTLLQDPSLILLDEPFAAVDAHTTSDLLDILLGWHRDGRTIIAALHDLGQVRDIFPRTLLMAGRPVAWADTAGVLAPANLKQAIGREVLPPAYNPPADDGLSARP